MYLIGNIKGRGKQLRVEWKRPSKVCKWALLYFKTDLNYFKIFFREFKINE
jgi:hypothetical protein